jgi:cysteinyl-tRNA synthetase
MIVFTNTPSRRKEEFIPLDPPRVTMYTCGPTVYNFAHIGNFRAIIAYDLVKRWLTCRGYDVKHVMNITDVDDKTINSSREEGLALGNFTRKYTDAFFQDCAKLRISPPDITPAATGNIPRMIKLVEILVEKGIAYPAEDGSVYFSIAKCDNYGKLSHLDTRDLQHGARIDHDEYDKDHVSDFVLWKGWSEAVGDVKWDSPWGPGRPGWHLECSVMAQAYLGDTIDIHMGGEDLVFPHHENEIAQSEAATGKPFVRYWLHNGYLLVEGKKMSKSLGNFYTLRDVLDRGYTGREIRYHLLSTHYRQPFNFTFDGLHAARSALQRLDDVRAGLTDRMAQGTDGQVGDAVAAAVNTAETSWTGFLDDDINISPALGALFALVHQANIWLAAGTVSGADATCILAFLNETERLLAVAGEEEEFPAEAIELMAQRTDARTDKDWSRADDIRNQLAAMGFTVEDTPHGPRLKRI